MIFRPGNGTILFHINYQSSLIRPGRAGGTGTAGHILVPVAMGTRPSARATENVATTGIALLKKPLKKFTDYP